MERNKCYVFPHFTMSTFWLMLAGNKGFSPPFFGRQWQKETHLTCLCIRSQSSSGHHSIPPVPPAKQRLYCVNQPRLPVLPARPQPRLTLAGQCGYPFILAKTKSPAVYSRGRGRAMSLDETCALRWLYKAVQFSPGPSTQGEIIHHQCFYIKTAVYTEINN